MRYLEHLREARRRKKDERGAALVEFAIALPIFIALLALIFDAGLGYSASRSSASAARSAARVGALAGVERDADFRVLDALKAQYGNGEDVQRIVIYRSDPTNAEGKPPVSCDDNCNEYPGSILDGLTANLFTDQTVPILLDDGTIGSDCSTSAPDYDWCPLNRRDDEGAFLGVYIQSKSQAAVGLGTSAFDLEDRAVFALYFPPLPVEG